MPLKKFVFRHISRYICTRRIQFTLQNLHMVFFSNNDDVVIPQNIKLIIISYSAKLIIISYSAKYKTYSGTVRVIFEKPAIPPAK